MAPGRGRQRRGSLPECCALTMAARLGFPASRADQLALAVTEAASNLHKHARQGSLLLAVDRGREAPGMEAW